MPENRIRLRIAADAVEIVLVNRSAPTTMAGFEDTSALLRPRSSGGVTSSAG